MQRVPMHTHQKWLALPLHSMEKSQHRKEYALQNLDVYIREVRREQVLGPFTVGTIRFRKDHDSIFCDGLLPTQRPAPADA